MYLAKTVIFNEKIELENQEFYCFNMQKEDLCYVRDFELSQVFDALDELDDVYEIEENY